MPHDNQRENEDEEREWLYAQRVHKHLRVPRAIAEAYHAAWCEFYGWEPFYCETTLNTLQASIDPTDLASYESLLEDTCQWDASCVEELVDIQAYLKLAVPMEAPHPSTSICVASTESGRVSTVQVDEVEIFSLPILSYACPKYESCTPAIRNIFHRVDQQELGYIPYADEPGFEGAVYAGLFDAFAWQRSWYDVDYKVIALHATWTLSHEEIHPTSIDVQQIPYYPEVTGRTGLLSNLQKRDFLSWDFVVPWEELRFLRQAAVNTTEQPSLWRSVSSMDAIFCRSTNCVEVMCPTHKSPKFPLRHIQHRRSNLEYAEDIAHGKVCDARCYRDQDDMMDDDPLVIDGDVYDSLKIFPDASMCKLARLCRVDCRDVYHHRLYLLPHRHSSIPELGAQAMTHRDRLQSDPYLCNHEGSCREEVCVCARDGRRCSRRCGCAARCAIRTGAAKSRQDAQNLRKGCACKNGICKADCPCHANACECSPELCIRPKTIDTATARNGRYPTQEQAQEHGQGRKHFCKFMHTQLEIQPDIIVKQGTYGFGAFALKDIAKNTYLGEYTAEMIPDLTEPGECERFDTAESMINKYRGLNYIYTVHWDDDEPIENGGFVLDAATVGNPMRSFNDSLDDPSKINVIAARVDVDGDGRIAMYAKKNVKAGQELLLSYGKSYWNPANNK